MVEAMSNTTDFDLAEGLTAKRRVAHRMHAFSNRISGLFFGRTEQLIGISLPEWRVLRAILLRPGVSQAEVATAEGLNVMSVSRAVAGLREKGLATVKPDPVDRRRTMLCPTDLGEDLGAEMSERESAIYAHVFDVLSDEEVDQLDDLMRRVTNTLQTRELPDPPTPSRDWAHEFKPDSSQ